MTASILHIGASKCGSSALQYALTRHPMFESASTRFTYVCIRKGGVVRAGKDLAAEARSRPQGFNKSVSARTLASLGADTLGRVGEQIREIVDGSTQAILSNEGWLKHSQVFESNRLLTALELEAHVICFVRPQVSVLNSGWWQWGAWTGNPLAQWVGRRASRLKWASMVKKWSNVPGVKRVGVRLLSDDIVGDFSQTVGVDRDVLGPRETVNRSLPGTILRAYQRHRDLRPGPHNAALDFIFEKYFGDIPDRTPWVLDQGSVEHIIQTTHEDNLELLELLDPVSREQMKGDRRWWDATQFADLPVEPWQAQPPRDEMLDTLFARALSVISRLEQENIELRDRR
jgi:hypothetical protein